MQKYMDALRAAKSLEDYFLLLFKAHSRGLPTPEREYRPIKGRRFRADFYWPHLKVAVEIEGGTWVKGRHVRGKGYEDDCKKYNLFAAQGILTLRYTTSMLKRNGLACIEQVKEVIGERRRKVPH